jgi:hypothetical protein
MTAQRDNSTRTNVCLSQFRIGCARAALLVACGLVFLAGPARRAEALTMYDVDVVCPIDGKPFATQMVAAYRSTGIRLDLKPLGDVIAPYPYPVCPGNGFVMYQNKFSDDELTALKSIVSSPGYQQARREHTDRYMVAYMKERLGSTRFERGHLYLQASWEAERDKPALLEQYRSLSLENFDIYLRHDDSHMADWWTAAILAAELERLLGHFDAAEARLDTLPLDLIAKSGLDDAFVRSVIREIRLHARIRNSAPEEVREAIVGASLDWIILLSLGDPNHKP